MRIWPTMLGFLACACAEYPRDIDGTFDRVKETSILRVGYTTLRSDDASRAKMFVTHLERYLGAHAQTSVGPVEQQLALLEAGKLDLVMGEFAEDSPWLADVALIEPLTRHHSGERMVGLAPVAANGENRWIMMLEREVRKVGKGEAR